MPLKYITVEINLFLSLKCINKLKLTQDKVTHTLANRSITIKSNLYYDSNY